MLDKLEQIENRYAELTQQLSSPELLANPSAYGKAAKQHRTLGEVVQKYQQWKGLKAELEGARELFDTSDDDEMREMARLELETLQTRLDEADRELKLLLIPTDPNDEKNVILEIRAGTGGDEATLFAADDTDFQARIIEGSADNHPVIDAVLHVASATAPTVHSALAKPLQGDIEVVVRGFNDLAPKPFAQRFRELQASGGSIAVKSLRIERSDATVVGSGTLTVKPDGKLDGVITVAINGIESIVPDLGLDKMIGQGIDKLAGLSGQSGQGGLAALDRLMPGLSGVVSAGATASVIDNLKKMGQPTEIDGKPATALPLRFADGAVYLGMIRIGEVPALF